MAINKFTNEPDKPFHSSAYAEAANGGSIGATSSQSFQQRYEIDRNRRSINRYRDSHIAHGSGRDVGSRRIGTLNSSRRLQSDTPTRQQQNATPTPIRPLRTSFNEPSMRKYNPYS